MCHDVDVTPPVLFCREYESPMYKSMTWTPPPPPTEKMATFPSVAAASRKAHPFCLQSSVNQWRSLIVWTTIVCHSKNSSLTKYCSDFFIKQIYKAGKQNWRFKDWITYWCRLSALLYVLLVFLILTVKQISTVHWKKYFFFPSQS